MARNLASLSGMRESFVSASRVLASPSFTEVSLPYDLPYLPTLPPKKYKYRPQCVSPRQNWDPPTPLPQASVTSELPPESKGGGTHSPAGEGVGESQFRRLEKMLSTLPTVCYNT